MITLAETASYENLNDNAKDALQRHDNDGDSAVFGCCSHSVTDHRGIVLMVNKYKIMTIGQKRLLRW